MSKYDKEREKMGLKSTSATEQKSVNTSSKYAKEREALLNPPAPEEKTPETVPRFIDYRNSPLQQKVDAFTQENPIASPSVQPEAKKESLLSKIWHFDPAGMVINAAGDFIKSQVEAYKQPSPLGPSKTDYPGGNFNPLNLLGKFANTKVAQGLSNIGRENAVPGLSGLNIAAKALETQGAKGIAGGLLREAPSYEGLNLTTKANSKAPVLRDLQPVRMIPEELNPQVQTPSVDAGLLRPAEAVVPKIEQVTPKYSPEIQAKLDQINAEIQDHRNMNNDMVAIGIKPRDQADSDIKGYAMSRSAEKRDIIQGDSLIPVEGGLTPKELSTKINKLKTNYTGKPVTVNGADGTIKKMAFGKVGVEFPDGSVKYFEQDAVKPKVDVDELIKSQRAPKNTPVAGLSKEPSVPPKIAPKAVPNERGFITTLKQSPKNEELKPKLNATYKPLSNQETVDRANLRIADDLDKSASYVLGEGRFTPEKVTTGLRLIDEFSKTGQHQRAVDIAEKLAKEGTKAGQSIQAFSIYNRLSPEGILIHANRIAERTNEKLFKSQSEVKVTPQIAAQLTDLATTTQKMTGVKELSNDVMNIFESAKAGRVLTDVEKQKLSNFVQDAKQFIQETIRRPRAPKVNIPKDPRIRDNVVSFLDAQEQAAKERLRNKGIQISSMPLDVYADYAIIGASKLAKGTIKFADWSEQMVKDLGEEIRPYLQQLYERASETLNQSTKKVSASTISQAEKIADRVMKGKTVTGEEADAIRDLAKKVSGLSGEAKTVASQDLQAVLQRLEKVSVLKKIDTTQTIAQLLNPRTHARNAIGNELFYRLERINKYISTPIDIAKSKITGGQRTVTFRTNSQGEYWKNWLKGWSAGLKGLNPEGLTTQYDLRPQVFTSKLNPLHYLEKLLGASLKSFDYAAYKRASNETLGELATLRAINEGKGADKELIQRYIRDADENLHTIANEYGKYVTFQDNNLISVGLSKLKRGLNFGKDFGVGSLILKYPRTPGALLMRALEYSPAGFLRSAFILGKPIVMKSAEKHPREVTLALSRAIMGTTGLAGMGYFLADKGIITGAASKDRDVRALQTKIGQGQYQVNLSALRRWVLSGFDPDQAKIQEGDLLYSYDWAQPIAIAISLGANVQQTLHEHIGKKSLGIAGTTYSSLSSSVDTLTNQSVLSGLQRAAQGYPGQSVTDKIASVLSDVPASFAPSLLNQVNQLADNKRRETYDPSLLQQSINRLKVRVPGLAQTLPQRYDTLGKPSEIYQDGGNNLFNVLLNPGYANKYNVTPEAKLVIDLINKTGDTTIAPRIPQKSINIKVNGETQRVPLTTEQYARIEKLTGEEVQKRLLALEQSANFANYSDETKIRAIVKILNDAGEKARYELKKEMGVR